MSLTKSSHGLCDSTMNFHPTVHAFMNYLTLEKKIIDQPAFRTPCMCLMQGRGVGTTRWGTSKPRHFLQTEPGPQWLLSSAEPACAEQKSAHRCFILNGTVLISRSSVAFAVAWMHAAALPDRYPTLKTSEFFFWREDEERESKLKKVVLVLQT